MTMLSNQERWRPWMAFALEGIVLALLATVCGAMQASWGRAGLVLTELLFLALAVGTARLHKTPLQEVFPLHAPTLREVGGVVVLGAAGMMLSMIATGVSLAVIPQSIAELQAIGDFLYADQGLMATVLVIAVLPALCEEALHRGAILSHLRSLRRDWVIVLIMGALFGLFHLSVSRFLSTSVLGCLLSYLMVKKNNIALPMLMHFLNNLYSAVVGSMAGNVGDAMGALQSIPVLQLVGTYCVVGCLAPILLVLAMRLVDSKDHRGRQWLIAGLCSAILLVGGLACISLAL